MASVGDAISLIMPSFVAADRDQKDGGEISSLGTKVNESTSGFLFSVTALKSPNGTLRTVRKFFIRNNYVNLYDGKIWLASQEYSGQIKLAHARGASGSYPVNDNTVADPASGLPQYISSYGIFTDASTETSAILFQNTGSLASDDAVGFWVLQEIPQNMLRDGSIPFTIKIKASFDEGYFGEGYFGAGYFGS